MVSGGTNFWTDYTERYQYTWKAQMKDRAGESADGYVSAAKHFESTTLFGLKVGCKNPDLARKGGLAESFKTKVILE